MIIGYEFQALSNREKRESAMFFTRPAHNLIIITACLLGMLAKTPVFAMDITIGHGMTPAPFVFKARQKPAGSDREPSVVLPRLDTRAEARALNKRKDFGASAEKARRREKGRRSRITSYSLFGDPFMRQGAASSQHALRAAGGVSGLGSGFGWIAPDSAAPASGKIGVNARGTAALEAGPAADNSGIAFACRDRPASPARLQVTACYIHKVDKAWKTQTYVSKGLADSSPGWGGGLAVGYDY